MRHQILLTRTARALFLAGVLSTAPADAQSVWTKRTSPTGEILSAVTWTGTQLVAVGDAGVILTSPDGITWTKRVSGTSNSLKGVAWSGSLLVAVGDGVTPFNSPPTVLTSPNGVTWTAQSNGGYKADLTSIAWSGSLFITAGTSFGICGFSSSNGTTWTTIGAPCNCQAMAWTGTLWVSAGSLGELWTSPNGTSWTKRLTTSSSIYSVASNGNRIVAVDASGNAFFSTNGTSWDSVKVSSSTLTSIVWTGTRFVAMGSGAFSSLDGITWTKSSVDGSGNGLAWTGSLLVAVGSDGIYTAPQGSVAIADRIRVQPSRMPTPGTFVWILDAAGRSLWSGPWERKVQASAYGPGLPPGSYTLEFRTGNERRSVPLKLH